MSIWGHFLLLYYTARKRKRRKQVNPNVKAWTILPLKTQEEGVGTKKKEDGGRLEEMFLYKKWPSLPWLHK
jgi:hypothetical protein